MNGCKIVPIAVDQKFKHPKVKYKHLPQHEFSLLVVAPKGSGKTNIIGNLLINHYKGYFHRVIVVSGTIDNDEKWDVIKKTKGVLAENKKLNNILHNKPKTKDKDQYPELVRRSGDPETKQLKMGNNKFDGKLPKEYFLTDMNDLLPMMQEQDAMITKMREKGYKQESKFLVDRILIILDDQAGLFSSATNSAFTNFIFRHRHYNTSIIIATQAYKQIPKPIRTNMNALILFEIPNKKEVDVVYEEWPANMERDQWDNMYNYVTQDDYAFVYMNMHFEKGKRVYKCFDEVLSLK